MVQAFFTYGYDNSYVAKAVSEHSDRLVGISVLDPLAAESPDLLSDLVENHGIRGIRLMNDRGRTPVCIDDPKTFGLWERAGSLNVPLSIAALLTDAPAIRTPLERFPQVRASLDHIWGLDFTSGSFDQLVAPILELAEFPNFQLKIAPTNTFAAREAGLDPVELYRLLVGSLGSERLIWGSNYPVRWGKQGTLKERLEAEQAIWSFLPSAKRANVFGDNAARLWPS
jgi:predicted TIM-barrel fold metal-dependent hydrolase